LAPASLLCTVTSLFRLIYTFSFFLFSFFRRHPFSILFPYTTLFRSLLVVDPQAFADFSGLNTGENDQVVHLGSPLLSPFNGLMRSEEHTSELQSRENLVCRLLLEKINREIDGSDYHTRVLE